MKRRDLLAHLRSHGCALVREGRGHSVWRGPDPANQATVPRHREVNDYTARAACRQLGIPDPWATPDETSQAPSEPTE